MKKMLAIATSAALLVTLSSEAGYAAASQPSSVSNATVTNKAGDRGTIVPTVAFVKPFDLYGKDILNAYNDVFKMNTTHIKSITNNGGNYSSSTINKAIDGELNTHWETGKPNSSTFTNEVVFLLDEATTLDRIVYAARQTGAKGKGFAQEFEIYSSMTDAGDDFTLVTSGEYKGSTGDVVEMKFAPTAFKRIKFVFKKANQDWASAAEFAFYKKDAVSDKMNKLFTDNTYSQVSGEFNTVEKITSLENEAVAHPLYSQFKAQLDLAQKIVSGELQTEGLIITAEQHGDMKKHAQQNLRFSMGTNNQPTGLIAMPGDTINVYVDVSSTDQVPSLIFSQQEGAWNSWAKGVQLRPGKNTIVVPENPTTSAYAHDVTKGGPIYIVNPYTSEEQGQAPRIRFEGAERFPMMTQDTDPAEFKALLNDYKQRLDADKTAHPNVKDREMIDVVEMVSNRIIFTGTTTQAYNAFITKNQNPLDTLTGYDVWINRLFDYFGLDGRNVNHDPKLIRENIRLMQPYGAMYAAGDHTGIQAETVALMLEDFSKVYPGWGLSHEIGHRMAVGEREYGEVSNNMLPMLLSVERNSIDTRIPFESDIYKYVIQENKVAMEQQGLFARLGAFWQLELAHPGYWAQLNSLYRDRKVSLPNGESSRQQYLVEFSSEVLGQDLSSFFARHGFTVNPETKLKVSKYPASNKLWYLNNSVVSYEGTGMATKNVPIHVNISSNEAVKTNTLTFNMDKAYKEDFLGYEIYRDNVLVGFTAKNQFIDNNIDGTQNYTYRIVGYDKRLNTLSPVEVKAFKPTLSVEEHITLKLNQAFNPINYVSATNYQGQDIVNTVTVKSNNVDITTKGNYEVVYEIKNEGATETKTAHVTVTSDYVYASDLDTASATVGWSSLRKDLAPSSSGITLIRQGLPAAYAKGLGVHANSEIVYNIEGKGYDYFESYIGIDQAMKGNAASSATFEIYVDGERKFSSDVFKSSTEHEFIQISVTGAREIKLVTTDANHNGNTADHTVWADAKFLVLNSVPTLTIPKSISTKVGHTLPIIELYTAVDAEDGDLTSNVVVSGREQVNFNRVGKYPITYTVTDSDGNTVTGTRTIAVVNMEDYKYLTDYDWTSTKNSYTAPHKDISISNHALRLTDENNREVIYDRGIGAHSNSTIVYDLNDKDYNYFTSYVGVDRQMYGSVGSVSFEVYVDGEKKFDSGMMNSKDPQKFIDVDINEAKELKLVVTDGGNGNGSDHATWGDTKLHFVNTDKLFTGDLEHAVTEAEAINLNGYTEESATALTASLSAAEAALVNKEVTQDEVDTVLAALRTAMAGLTEVDLTAPIVIQDDYLRDSIKTTLGIAGDLTHGDILKLKSLNSKSGRIESLDGLQYANNLVTLDITGNAITDFSPLKGLTKLNQLIANPQIVQVGELKGSVIEITNLVTGIDGNKVIPYSASVRNNKTFKETLVDVSNWQQTPEKFTVDISNEEKGYYTLNLAYEVEGNLIGLIYLINNY
ncbi:NPCBM/NEW2 domain-containing protein [Paenibacillus sp. BIC5C1]|uniref:NPCBM/NEW2 domain-containing protein n=1 Tax=Paenibacillus sp. BIC5C1 TaxID=3078263 RepID=UPI0028F106A8|nr:NPCBM/NEW2 domain-containing protein [Paenibacillus sp. BIC5C1]